MIRKVLEQNEHAARENRRRFDSYYIRCVNLLGGAGCHLNATHVQQALRQVSLNELDLLIIENVGNPICPVHFDLGEHPRIAVLSVAEGHDKPSKYPLLFKDAQLVVITKCDLLPYVDSDPDIAQVDVRRVNRSAELIRTDIETGQGFDRLAEWMSGNAVRPTGDEHTAEPGA